MLNSKIMKTATKSRVLEFYLEGGKLLVTEVLSVIWPAGNDKKLHAVHRPSRLHTLATLAPWKNHSCNQFMIIFNTKQSYD